MKRLGGNVIGFYDQSSSSVTKGESLSDTIRTVSSYADIISIRHPKEGAALVASRNTSVPVINAGDGGREHPTQTLTDLLTIKMKKQTLEGLTIGFCGDLKFGRTVHSLVKNISRYHGTRFIFISPNELRIPEALKNYIEEHQIPYQEVTNLEDNIGDLDVLYMTRVQKERFMFVDEYLKLKDQYILDLQKLTRAKKDMIILHPLPRVNEISPEVDLDSRAVYFDQVKYGMHARMALIMKIMGCCQNVPVSSALNNSILL